MRELKRVFRVVGQFRPARKDAVLAENRGIIGGYWLERSIWNCAKASLNRRPAFRAGAGDVAPEVVTAAAAP